MELIFLKKTISRVIFSIISPVDMEMIQKLAPQSVSDVILMWIRKETELC